MCGILGMVSNKEFSVNDELLSSLKRLEYRGYDSWGFATGTGRIYKAIGSIDHFPADTKTNIGISHTRWATHGCVTDLNSHPHFNKEKNIMAVHNGIIENHEKIKFELEREGYVFVTQTDSEIIPHFFDHKIRQGRSMKEAMYDFLDEVEGTFAVLIIMKGDKNIYTMKRDSPLVLGILKDKFVLASDVYAFSDKSNRAIFFDDDEFAIINSEGYEFFAMDGKSKIKKVIEFERSWEEASKNEFPHYMIKEIKEQPSTSRRLLQSFTTTQKQKVQKFSDFIFNSKRVVFVSCGTSYHASLIGVYLLNKLGIRSHAVIASEFENFVDIGSDTTIVALSQSGETMDVMTVLKEAAKKGAEIISIVNVPYSSVQRVSRMSLEILAGQEVCVASTKTFTNQLVTLFAIALELGYDGIDLAKIPSKIENTIKANEGKIKKLAESLLDEQHIYVLGRGLSYPVAREFALKLKEISYIHAEGMMAGELKHGTLALVEEGTPVISLISNRNTDMISSTREVEARGARTIKVSNTGDGDINVEASDDAEFAIYSTIVGHLLSYHIAEMKGYPIDKPRNLAKSVTVK